MFPAVGYNGDDSRKIAADMLHNYVSRKTQTTRLCIHDVLSYILVVMKVNSTFTEQFSSTDVFDSDEDTEEVFILKFLKVS